MANKKSKQKTATKSQATKEPSVFKMHSFWIVTLLFAALAIVTVLGVITIKKLESERRTDMDIARLEVFDDVAADFVRNLEVRDSVQTFQEMTGYGISDEDGVFYITFNYYISNDDGSVNPTAHPAIIYFWKDAERGTYSHAFSYPDDPSYHPDGLYIEKSSYRLPLQSNK